MKELTACKKCSWSKYFYSIEECGFPAELLISLNFLECHNDFCFEITKKFDHEKGEFYEDKKRLKNCSDLNFDGACEYFDDEMKNGESNNE